MPTNTVTTLLSVKCLMPKRVIPYWQCAKIRNTEDLSTVHGSRINCSLKWSLLLCSSAPGGSTSVCFFPFFSLKINCICDCFPFPSHILPSKIDLVCVVFLCMRTMVWLQSLRFSKSAKMLLHVLADRGCTNTVDRVCTES